MNGPTIVIIVSVIYTIVLYLIIRNDITAHTKEYEGLYIFLAMLGFFLLGMLYIWAKRKDIFYGTNDAAAPTWWSFLLKCLGIISFFGVALLIIMSIMWGSGYIPDIVSGILVVVNIVIISGIISAILKFTKKEVVFTNNKSWRGLFTNIIYFLPCIWIETVEWFKKQWNDTTPTAWWILFIDLVFILLYSYKDVIYNYLFRPTGKVLLNEPVYINKETDLGSFENLNEGKDTDSDEFKYNYAISSWIYINYQGPNTNSSYSEYTSLFNYGNKPNIEYLGTKNTLRITMPEGQDGTKVVYETSDIKMNKWNNFVINYAGGTLDVFINGELVMSEKGVIPYMEFDTVKSGSSPGIHGGICNVQYFDRTLSLSTIKSLYSSLSNKTPPII